MFTNNVMFSISIFGIGLFLGYEVNQLRYDKFESHTRAHYNDKLRECSDVIAGYRK